VQFALSNVVRHYKLFKNLSNDLIIILLELIKIILCSAEESHTAGLK